MKIIINIIILLLLLIIIVPKANSVDGIFTISFPLLAYHPYNAPIGSVFDHSMKEPYDKDATVIAYTGETGDFIKSFCFFCDGCYSSLDEQKFKVNSHYTGVRLCGRSRYLCYDGHPGFDYPTSENTPVYAAADGLAYIPDSYPGRSNAQLLNTVEVDHQNGYKTYYLHLKKQIITDGQPIKRGQLIGFSGNVGSPGFFHLHFEVQQNGIPIDPYGWEGDYPDPYPFTSINLWSISTTLSEDERDCP